MMFLGNISKRGKLGQKEKLGDVSHVLADTVRNLRNLLPTNVHKVLLILPRVHMDAFDEGGTCCMLPTMSCYF